MMKLLEFHRSPNAVKVRVALYAKGLDFVTEEMYAADREPMLAAAGWPMIPILIDGPVVMRDSLAILHYLEANYRDCPSLTPSSRDDILKAEALLANLNPTILRLQWQLSGEYRRPDAERDHARIEAHRSDVHHALERLDLRLGRRPWMVGEAMSIYDIVLACNLIPTRPPVRFVEASPVWRFFDRYLRLDDSRANVGAWIDRVVALDRPMAGSA